MFKFNQLTKRIILGLSVVGLLATSQPVRSYYPNDNCGAMATLALLGLCVSTLLYTEANLILQDAIPNEPAANKRNAVKKSELVSAVAMLCLLFSQIKALGTLLQDLHAHAGLRK